MQMNDKIILGIMVKDVTAGEAVALVDSNVVEGRRAAVAYLNAHTALQAVANKQLRQALMGFLVFNDGVGVDIAARMKYGARFSDNLNGTDFTPRYLAETKHKFRIYLLGAQPGVAADVAKIFAARFPQHNIAGYHDGYFSAHQSADVAQTIRASGANLLLVAMGNPAQEIWIAENLEKTGAVLAFGVGALFDFTAGRFPRAPEFVRKLRAEWLYRLAKEPKRLWQRYTVNNVAFLSRAAWDALNYRVKNQRAV
jgi:alpha-1,3-mannosyltransferase